MQHIVVGNEQDAKQAILFKTERKRPSDIFAYVYHKSK